MTDKSKKNLYKLKTDGNAFRIAAFGFDKNDVTLYINELSKRFTQMEQEYQEKINRLLNNGAVSTEVKEENSLLQSEQNEQIEQLKKNNIEQSECIKILEIKVDELQKQLESASAERDELKNQNEKLLEELKNSRQHIDNANNILDKYSEELSGSFSAAKKEIDNSIAEIAGQLENFRKAFDSFNSNINANKAEQKNISDISVSDAMNENTDMSTHAAEYLEDISEYDTDTEGSGNKAEDIEQLNNSLSGYNNSSDLIFSEDSLEENNLDYILTASDELQEDEFLTFMPDKKNNISNDFDLSDDLYEILINSENNQFQENENNLEANLKKAYSHSDIVSDSDEGMEEVPL